MTELQMQKKSLKQRKKLIEALNCHYCIEYKYRINQTESTTPCFCAKEIMQIKQIEHQIQENKHKKFKLFK